MIYPYSVKVRGKWYAPGENIPDETASTAKDATTEAVKPTEAVEKSAEEKGKTAKRAKKA